MNDEGKIVKSIRRRAVGYTVTETAEEYALVDGEMTLVKRKVTSATCPPTFPRRSFIWSLAATRKSLPRKR